MNISLQNATNTQVLFTVTASDLDINENSLLQFSLQNYDNVFSINPSTGEIMLQTMLDYDESDREYQLSIEVTDLAVDFSSRQTDHATLNILVEDINDNKPMFVQVWYSLHKNIIIVANYVCINIDSSKTKQKLHVSYKFAYYY